jgi:DNA-binding protein YbaB
MSQELGISDLDQLLSRTRQAATSMRADASGEDEAADIRGEGFDADGHIRVVVASGGRVEAVEVGQRAMRLGSHELAQRVLAAVNAALDDVESKTAELVGPAGADMAELTGRLREAQDLSLRQLRSYTQSLRDLMNGFERR